MVRENRKNMCVSAAKQRPVGNFAPFAMNVWRWSLFVLMLMTIGLAKKKKKINSMRVRVLGQRAGHPIKIIMPKKKASRRRAIVKCCGFKRCQAKFNSSKRTFMTNNEDHALQTTIFDMDGSRADAGDATTGTDATADETTIGAGVESSEVVTETTVEVASTDLSTLLLDETTTSLTTEIPCLSDKMSCAEFKTYLTIGSTSKPSDMSGSLQMGISCKRKYYVSDDTESRNEAGLRCKQLNMTLLTISSLEELDCLSSLDKGLANYWTSGMIVDPNCKPKKLVEWCSTGFNASPALISSERFVAIPDPFSSGVAFAYHGPPPKLTPCLAVLVPLSSSTPYLVLSICSNHKRYVCQSTVDCPKQCIKNDYFFDSNGNLKNSTSYGTWFNIGNYTYLLGNKLMTWESSYHQCCALGMEALNIENAEEQVALTSLTLGGWKANFNYWTSGTWKGAPEGEWSWCKPSGPVMISQSLTWEKGQPDNQGKIESCVHFRFVFNSTGTILTDRNCAHKYLYACKVHKIYTTPRPCIAACPDGTCKRNANLFDSQNTLLDYFSYGNWFSGCGRNFLFYTTKSLDWKSAWFSCCEIGLTLASIESQGKSSCFNKFVSAYPSETLGDFWLSGNDIGCPSNYWWCSVNRAFVDSEIKWKPGHPQPGLNCVYLEARFDSVLLATADCGERKQFLCDVRKNATFQRAMQTECAETWNVTTAEIDLLLNTSAFLAANISINLMCFLKCVGFEAGLFDLGALVEKAIIRQMELVTQEEPEQMQKGFMALEECRGKKFDDECVTAYEIFKCAREKAPDLVSKIISNSFDNGTVYTPPVPCVPMRRTCQLQNQIPCEINQTIIDELKANNGSDKYGYMITYQGKPYYISYKNYSTALNPVMAYKRCCARGMRLVEPKTLEDIAWFASRHDPPNNNMIVGETVAINQTHEVWCRSRKFLPSDLIDPDFKHQCTPSFVFISSLRPKFSTMVDPLRQDYYAAFYLSKEATVVNTGIHFFSCEAP